MNHRMLHRSLHVPLEVSQKPSWVVCNRTLGVSLGDLRSHCAPLDQARTGSASQILTSALDLSVLLSPNHVITFALLSLQLFSRRISWEKQVPH